MIRIEGLTKVFTKRRPGREPEEIRAVDGVSAEIAEGEVFGLLGPNGAGKTTTIRMLAQLMQPTAGRFWIGDIPHTEPQRFRHLVGALIEQPGLYNRLTLREYLTFFGQLYDLEAKALAARVEELVDLLDITDRVDSRLEGFSMGMRQKAALARILIHDPPVLLLDEPTAGLDPIVTRKVRTFLLGTHGKTTILSTHHLDEAERVCHKIAVINYGRVLAVGTPAELRRRYQGPVEITVTFAEVKDAYAEVVTKHLGPECGMQRIGQALRFHCSDYERLNPQIVADLVARGAEIVTVDKHVRSLEEIYVDLLGGWEAIGPEGI